MASPSPPFLPRASLSSCGDWVPPLPPHGICHTGEKHTLPEASGAWHDLGLPTLLASGSPLSAATRPPPTVLTSGPCTAVPFA